MTQDLNYDAIGRYLVATENMRAAIKERSDLFKKLCSYFDRLDCPVGEHEVVLVNRGELDRVIKRLVELNGDVQQAAAEANHSAAKAGRPALNCHVQDM